MVRLSKSQLAAILSWAKSQDSKTQGDLLSRARRSLAEWDRVLKEYSPSFSVRPTWFGVVVEHSCRCPAWRPDVPCKHVIGAILLAHRDILSASSWQWASFFQALDAYNRARSASSSASSSRPAGSSGSSSRPSGSSGSSGSSRPRSFRRRPSGGSGGTPQVPPEFHNF
jgi:uncharacterized membrane protein YgcG